MQKDTWGAIVVTGIVLLCTIYVAFIHGYRNEGFEDQEYTPAERANMKAWIDKTPTGPDAPAASASKEVRMATAAVIAGMTETPEAPKGTFRPCEVYFTDNMKTCDKNEFRYHPIYYETKLAELKRRIGDRPPSATESAEIVRLERILADYKKFPDGIHCKAGLPNWKELITDKRTPFIADNVHNRDRGNKDHWAFCWRPLGPEIPDGPEGAGATVIPGQSQAEDADATAKIEASGMLIQKVNGVLQGKTLDNVFHVRGTFDEAISVDSVKKTFCAETADVVPYTIKAALVIEDAPGKRQFTFYKNDAPAPLTDDDVARLWRDQFFHQQAQTDGAVEKVFAKPLARPQRLVKMSKDLCQRQVDDYSTIATVKFGDNILLSTTPLNQGSDFLRGTMPEVGDRIAAYDKNILALRNEIAGIRAKLDELRRKLAEAWKNYDNAVAQRNAAGRAYSACLNQPFQSISGWWTWFSGPFGPRYRVYVDPRTGQIGRSAGGPERMFGEYFYREGTLRHRRWFWGNREYIFGVRQQSDGKLLTENTPRHWLQR